MDRRVIWAIVLMMVIAIVPTILLKPPARPVRPTTTTTAAPDSGARPTPPNSPVSAGPSTIAADTGGGDTVWVQSALYRYGIATVGGRLVSASLPGYKSVAAADKGSPVQLMRPASNLLGLTLLVGHDTLRLNQWTLAPSAKALSITGTGTLQMTGASGSVSVDLTYNFRDNDYLVDVAGSVTGIGPNGGTLFIGMGPGLRHTEADTVDNQRQLAIVTKTSEANATHFRKLKPGLSTALDGPFEWVAVKSKYFVTAVFALDTTLPRIIAATATPPAMAGKSPTVADVELSMPLGPDGRFRYQLYAGPMEYARLRQIGHDFDDVNPYGLPGIRTLIRPVAVAVRWVLVWMHTHLHLAYGLVLVFFGIMVRLILWPLNQKAMRASMAMQAIQPQLKEIQTRYKSEPQKLQQEMFKLYKENHVNPFGGCWPLLIPMPVLFALFFVFGSTIELRGQSFLWLPDLSRPDPYFIIPVLMGLSMFVLSKVGMMGMPPNPQMKMMLYFMPVLMTVLFFPLASGLNLYYSVSNTASIPQQWLLAKERLRKNPPPPPAPPPKKKT